MTGALVLLFSNTAQVRIPCSAQHFRDLFPYLHFPHLSAWILIYNFFCTCVSVHRRDRCTCTFISLALHNSWPDILFLCTCVSVRRRDRCTCTLPPFFFGTALPFCPLFSFFVLCIALPFLLCFPVCLSIDVTGALVPLFIPPLFIFLFGLSGVSCTGFYCSITYGVCLSTDVTGALPPPTSHRTCESVHRRDRFIRTPSSSSDLYFPVAYLFFSSPLAFALVCPSTDVTGALVPAHPLFVSLIFSIVATSLHPPPPRQNY